MTIEDYVLLFFLSAKAVEANDQRLQMMLGHRIAFDESDCLSFDNVIFLNILKPPSESRRISDYPLEGELFAWKHSQCLAGFRDLLDFAIPREIAEQTLFVDDELLDKIHDIIKMSKI